MCVRVVAQVVQQAGLRAEAVVVLLVGQFAAVGAHQVVQYVAAVGVTGEQAGRGQFAQVAPGRCRLHPASVAAASADTAGPGCRDTYRKKRAVPAVSAR